MQAGDLRFEPVVGFEPTILPFTRQREVVQLRAAQILPVRKCQVSAGGTNSARSVRVAQCGSEGMARSPYGLQKDSRHPPKEKVS